MPHSTNHDLLSSNKSSNDAIQSIRREYSTLGDGSLELVKDEATGVAVLTLNHFDKRNSWSGRMMSQFHDILSDLEEWKEVSFLFLSVFLSFSIFKNASRV